MLKIWAGKLFLINLQFEKMETDLAIVQYVTKYMMFGTFDYKVYRCLCLCILLGITDIFGG